jgi:hypothetical protein
MLFAIVFDCWTKIILKPGLKKPCMTHDFLFARQITGSDALLQPLKAL